MNVEDLEQVVWVSGTVQEFLGLTDEENIQVWLRFVYHLAATDQLQKAADVAYDEVYELCRAEHWDLIDFVLQQVDECRLTTSLMRSFLTITWVAKPHLKNRDAFYDRVHTRMECLNGPQHTNRVLGSLV